MLYSASMMPYISETVHPSIRGSLTTLPAFMMAGGMLMVWIIGYFLTWRMTAFVLAIPPVLLTLFMLMLPETPYWLIGKFKSYFNVSPLNYGCLIINCCDNCNKSRIIFSYTPK